MLHSPDIDPLAALRDLERSEITPTIAAEVLPRLLNLAASLARACAFQTPASDVSDDKLLNVIEAAELLHVSESTIYSRQAELNARKIGSAVRFSRAELLKSAAKSRENDDDTLRERSCRPVGRVPRQIARL